MPKGIPKSGKRKCSIRVDRISPLCQACSNIRLLTPSQWRQRTGKFCSKKCEGIAKRGAGWKPPTKRIIERSREISCDQCKTLYRCKPSEIKRYNKHYCSRTCMYLGMKRDLGPNHKKDYMRDYNKRNKEYLDRKKKAYRKSHPDRNCNAWKNDKEIDFRTPSSIVGITEIEA